jgi:hypothetical protein
MSFLVKLFTDFFVKSLPFLNTSSSFKGVSLFQGLQGYFKNFSEVLEI